MAATAKHSGWLYKKVRGVSVPSSELRQPGARLPERHARSQGATGCLCVAAETPVTAERRKKKAGLLRVELYDVTDDARPAGWLAWQLAAAFLHSQVGSFRIAGRTTSTFSP